MISPDGPRWLSTAEIKALLAFPRAYQQDADWNTAVMQLGNSVSPVQAFWVIGPVWKAISEAMGGPCLDLDVRLQTMLHDALPPWHTHLALQESHYDVSQPRQAPTINGSSTDHVLQNDQPKFTPRGAPPPLWIWRRLTPLPCCAPVPLLGVLCTPWFRVMRPKSWPTLTPYHNN